MARLFRSAVLLQAGLAVFIATAPAAGAGNLPAVSVAQARAVDVPEAGHFLVTLADRAISGLTDRSLPPAERASRFRVLLTDGFDVNFIGRFVLGRHWRNATEAERADYLRLFEDYIVQSYAARFTEYAGENLRVAASRAGTDNDVTVFTDMLRPSGPPVKVEWKLRREGGSFKIVDVVVEGVSMSITQRDDFSAAIQRSGGKVEGLLAILRDKIRTARAN